MGVSSGTHSFCFRVQVNAYKISSRDVSRPIIETRVTNLLAGNAVMGWSALDPSTFVARTRAQKVIEISLGRLAELSEYWFSIKGPRRRHPLREGQFDNALPSGEELIAELRKQARTRN